MIDYEKLKEAYELCHKYQMQNDIGIYIFMEFVSTGVNYKLGWTCYEEKWFETLDDLIAKLKELTQPQPKYKIGQSVWFMANRNIIYNQEIDDIDLNSDEMYYIDDFGWFEKVDLYPSQGFLIQSQVDYWTNLLPDCDHESDGNIYTTMPPQNKCTKCHNFYRKEDFLATKFEGEVKGFGYEDHKIDSSCEHKSSGNRYVVSGSSKELNYCFKCGEIYK